ncbi:MAG: hypothetical protein EPO08_08855 [Rhodospirillaceae bacterium]|nr:MAG: hypothetical protein EPO08_08855 [Rhodospirillaceae bacterium]
MSGSATKRWSCLIVILGLITYLGAASSLPSSIIMAQTYDDALYIKLGRAIAGGHWLGHYDQLTLVKGPIYPAFLALASSTGLPFDIVQYIFYFLCCWYFSHILATVCGQNRLVASGVFVAVLICPTLYTESRVLREFFYSGLTLLLIAVTIDLLCTRRSGWRGALLGIGTGIVGAAHWMTREESLWIVPSLLVLVAGALYNVQAPTLKARAAQLGRPVLSACVGAAAVFLTVGYLNWTHYGRFVTDEMRDATFQRALTALQRVGGTFQKPYLPVPREARDLLYAQSPSFAALRDHIEPNAVSVDNACFQWKAACNDLIGAMFMWRLRDAVAQAGFAQSAKEAARFYHGLAKEIELACRMKRLPCADWLPPLIPPITPAQWQLLPATLGRAALLVAYEPPPSFDRQPSYLKTGDSADAVAFLNRPFAMTEASSMPHETANRERIRSAWVGMLGLAASIDRLLLVAGLASLMLTVILARRLLTGTAGIVTLALFAAVGTRIVLLSLVEISSFPAVLYERMFPAAPLVLAAAILSIYMLCAIKRSAQT